MTRIKYIEKRFNGASRALIDHANRIIAEYEQQGLVLTLRQIYYQFVARGLLPNRQQEYKRLGSVLNDARLAGLVSWAAMEDRTRYLRRLPHWDSVGDILDGCAQQFRIDKWAGQPWQPEVWIEKDALVGVIEGVCNENQVPYFACRGHNSQSEQWAAGMRIRARFKNNRQRTLILHFGDHDPSGVHMTEDNQQRLEMFAGEQSFEIRRLALNMDQIERYNPPPNPVKMEDSRAEGYIQQFDTTECWELDALEPTVIRDLIQEELDSIRVRRAWELAERREREGRALLAKLAEQNR